MLQRLTTHILIFGSDLFWIDYYLKVWNWPEVVDQNELYTTNKPNSRNIQRFKKLKFSKKKTFWIITPWSLQDLTIHFFKFKKKVIFLEFNDNGNCKIAPNLAIVPRELTVSNNYALASIYSHHNIWRWHYNNNIIRQFTQGYPNTVNPLGWLHDWLLSNNQYSSQLQRKEKNSMNPMCNLNGRVD